MPTCCAAALPTRAFGHPTCWTVRVISPRRDWVVHILREVPRFPPPSGLWRTRPPLEQQIFLYLQDSQYYLHTYKSDIFGSEFRGSASSARGSVVEVGFPEGRRQKEPFSSGKALRPEGWACRFTANCNLFIRYPSPIRQGLHNWGCLGAPGWHRQPKIPKELPLRDNLPF